MPAAPRLRVQAQAAELQAMTPAQPPQLVTLLKKLFHSEQLEQF
jgi:hypothetical protein